MFDPPDDEDDDDDDDDDGDGGFLAEELDKALEEGLDKLLKIAEVIFRLRARQRMCVCANEHACRCGGGTCHKHDAPCFRPAKVLNCAALTPPLCRLLSI